MFRDWIFYPLVAIAAAILIALSFGETLRPTPPGPVAGLAAKDALVFPADMLKSVDPGAAATHVVREGTKTIGLRIATPVGGAAPVLAAAARVRLDPSAAARLSQRPLVVELLTRPIPLATAPEIAVGLISNGTVQWSRQTLSTDPALAAFAFPATSGVDGIAIYPINPSPDRVLGVEIGEIRVREPKR